MSRGQKPFRITQFSDLHLTAEDTASRSEPRLLGRLKGMNKVFRGLLQVRLVQETDLLLVTGDVTDRGSGSAWSVFWDAVFSAGLRDRTLVVPGNHDVCWLGVRAPRGKPAADRARDRARARRGLRKGGQPTRFPWARQVDERVVIFGLDSCSPGNLTGLTNAMGEIGFPQLERLARLLRQYRQVPVKLVTLHHSPNIPGRETETTRGLPATSALARWGHEVPVADRRALRLLCLSQGVRVVVHGHLHRAEDRRVNGVRMVGCPASTEPMEEGRPDTYPVYRYTVQGDGGRVRVGLVGVRVSELGARSSGSGNG